MVARISHIDIPTAIHGYTTRAIESCSASPHAVEKGRGAPSASQGGYCTQGGDFSDAVVAFICHIHHPRRVYSEARGESKACRSPLPISPRKTTSCKCGCHSRGREFSYAMVIVIGNVNDARARVGCDTVRVKKTRCSSSAISPCGSQTIPREGAHKAREGHRPDAIVEVVCHIHHPRVCGNTSRPIKSSRRPLAIGKGRGTAPSS
jgi:hypothetical protein